MTITYSQGEMFKRGIPSYTQNSNRPHQMEQQTTKFLKILETNKQDFAIRLRAAKWLKKNSHVLSAVITSLVELVINADQETALLALDELADINDLEAFWFLQDLVNWGPTEEVRHKASQLSTIWEEKNQTTLADEEILLLPPGGDEVLLLPPVQSSLLHSRLPNQSPITAAAAEEKPKPPNSLDNLKQRPIETRLSHQLFIGSLGIGLAWLLYQFAQNVPKPLSGFLNWQTIWAPALLLLISIGYLEELLFRGLLQNSLTLAIGRWRAIFFVALLSTLLHVGYASSELLALLLLINLSFGWIVARTYSIIGVALARGLMYISLLLMWVGLF